MRWYSSGNFILLLLLFLTMAGSLPAVAQLNEGKPDNLKDVGITEKLGDTIPLDVQFARANGDSVTLRSLLAGSDKPVLLNPVYYDCPMLCTMVLDGVTKSIKKLEWQPGEDYRIITFSFDHTEDAEVASESRAKYLDMFGKDVPGSGWTFLSGPKSSVKKLTNAIGYDYEYIEEKDQYAHNASIAFLSPEGKITRYLYGIQFAVNDLKNALYEAADGNIGNTIDKVTMYCYQYDPSSNSYVPVAFNIMKLGGLLTMIILGTFLGLFWYKERKKS